MQSIQKNSEHIVEITGYLHNGQGVAKINSFAIFIDGAIIGERIKILIIKVSKNYAVGKILEVIEKSDYRVEPVCQYYSRCGGCSLTHMSYVEQLNFKKIVVEDAIRKIGKIDATVSDVKGNDEYRYRNKTILPVERSEKVAIGFFAKRSHSVISINDCLIQSENMNKVMNVFAKFLQDNDISIYDEEKKKGLVRNLMVREGLNTGEIMVVPVVNGEELPKKDLLINNLIENVQGIKSICLNVNRSQGNVVLGRENITIYGEGHITEELLGIKYRISPNSFFQVNTNQAGVLYSEVLDKCGDMKDKTVYDIYCGTGSISLLLAKKAKKVYGIEANEKAIDDANINAENNSIDNVEFIAGKAEDVFPELYEEKKYADIVVVDPPRSGCAVKVLDTIISMQPKKIVYVSCNPATLARDLNYLKEAGYGVDSIKPVDMFRETFHVETVVMLTQKLR